MPIALSEFALVGALVTAVLAFRQERRQAGDIPHSQLRLVAAAFVVAYVALRLGGVR